MKRKNTKEVEAYRILFIPDCHIPFQDARAYDMMIRAAQVAKVDEIVILGDYADFYAVNSHGKDAGVADSLAAEIDAVNDKLDELDEKFPLAKKVYLEGNHEYRLERYINSKCPDLFGLVTVPELFHLKARRWQWVPYTPDQAYSVAGGNLIARHTPLSGGTHVAHGTVVKAGKSVIFGHVHSLQESQVVDINGAAHRGISSGWLGDKKQPVFKYVQSHWQWSLGFSITTVLEDNTFFNQLIHIIPYKGKYRCMVDGILLEN